MISSEAVRSYICKFLASPDFLRVVGHTFVVTFWDQEGAKGMTLEIRRYDSKWALYVRAQDKVSNFGLASYADMVWRAKTFLRRLQVVLQRDYWYGPNDDLTVWVAKVHYKGSIYKAAIADASPKDAAETLGLRSRYLTRYWTVCTNVPEAIEAALRTPRKVWIEGDDSRWFEAESIPTAIPI